MTLHAYSFFHLNLAYSAITEERRSEVIEKCYWPLLRLAKRLQIPFGIEASAWTLKTVNEIDSAWIRELRDLVTLGPCEFIGSGYAQIIGPLVPADVNIANFKIGMSQYESILGLRPELALINEQAYSAGLVPLYREAGFKALIMEWDNPARTHPDWETEWRYLPQYAIGADGKAFPMIWNKSVAFQKVQRFVHGELDLKEYLDYVKGHLGESNRAFPVYGNDVEVFDFRPGRYMTEAPIQGESEWSKLEKLFVALLGLPEIRFIPPSQVLSLMNELGAGNFLQLETSEQPIPVKKQDKYNVLRWAVSGRDDLSINTKCWRIYEYLVNSTSATEDDWAELCYLWSSDFRTHITEQRWKTFLVRLEKMVEKCRLRQSKQIKVDNSKRLNAESMQDLSIETKGRFLYVFGNRLQIIFNLYRGLAIESFSDLNVSKISLFGTLQHGFYDDIKWAADFYSGHLVFESTAIAKVTDLCRVEPTVETRDGILVVSAVILTHFGKVSKTWSINDALGEIELSYHIDWPGAPFGSLRLGFVTLNPCAFNYNNLMIQTSNGGPNKENFSLFSRQIDHGSPVSFLISANQAFGVTDGSFSIGDHKRQVELMVCKSTASAVGMLRSEPIKNTYFSRIYFSILEQDDTSRMRGAIQENFKLRLRARIS